MRSKLGHILIALAIVLMTAGLLYAFGSAGGAVSTTPGHAITIQGVVATWQGDVAQW